MIRGLRAPMILTGLAGGVAAIGYATLLSLEDRTAATAKKPLLCYILGPPAAGKRTIMKLIEESDSCWPLKPLRVEEALPYGRLPTLPIDSAPASCTWSAWKNLPSCRGAPVDVPPAISLPAMEGFSTTSKRATSSRKQGTWRATTSATPGRITPSLSSWPWSPRSALP